LGLWDSRERQNWLIRWSLGAASTENWIEALDAEAVRSTLWVGWEVKREIPVYVDLTGYCETLLRPRASKSIEEKNVKATKRTGEGL
jgi:hypothetical protein